MDGYLNLELWLSYTTWWVDLLSFALISFSIGNLKSERVSLKQESNVLRLDYHIYPSYGEFKINKIKHLLYRFT